MSVAAISSLSDTMPVYDLSVADVPEFFANGILVHNCADALRYALYSFHTIGTASYTTARLRGV